MPRTLENLLTVRAPWPGINQRIAPEELPPNRPQNMRNLWIHRHALEARPGYSKAVPSPLPTLAEPNTPLPWQLAQVLVGKRDDPRATIFAMVGEYNLPPELIYLKANGEWDAIGLPSAAPLTRRGSFVSFYPYIFALFPESYDNLVGKISDPSSIATEGMRPLGMKAPDKPFVHPDQSALRVPGFTLPTHSPFRGVYGFAVSFYNADDAQESNATIAVKDRLDNGDPNPEATPDNDIDTLLDNTPGGGGDDSSYFIHLFVPDPQEQRATHFRIYMRVQSAEGVSAEADLGGETVYRLAAELPISRGIADPAFPSTRRIELRGADLHVGHPDDPEPSLSVRGIGPFRPTRNFPPPRSRYALPYQNKMLWCSVEEATGGLIVVSQDGRPESANPDDFIELPDAIRGDVTGCVVYQGRAVFFTDRSIFVLSGTVSVLSNDEAALSVPAPTPEYSIFRADSDVGCINTHGGNGVIEIEELLYFNGQQGIYTFDGNGSKKISDDIDNLWATLSDTARRSCTMAHDRRNNQLVICYGGPNVAGPPAVVRYNYRSREWCIDDVPNATCVADWIDAEPYYDGLDKSPQRLFLIGASDEDGLIGFLDEREDEDHDQPIEFIWEGGDMDFGLPSREKRLFHLTIDSNAATPHLRIDVTLEHADGRRNTKVLYQIENTTKAIHKRKLDTRAVRMRLKITGQRSSVRGQQKINSFAIDGVPIGHR